MNYLEMTDQDLCNLWEDINAQRILFHPIIAPEGRIVLKSFSLHRTELSIIADNNILIDLIKLCLNGSLEDTKRMKDIASLMLWVEINGLSISAGQALQEKAASLELSLLSKDFSIFQHIMSDYTPQQWYLLRCGHITELPTLECDSHVDKNMTIYQEKPDAYYQAYASVLRIVSLLREEKYDGFQRAKAFIEWTYNNTTIAKYIMAYGILLLTEREKGIKAPKKAFNANLPEVLNGCQNQAWDLQSVSAWSQILYMKEKESIPEMYMFATRDETLKRIIVAVIQSDDLMTFFRKIFNRKELNEIVALVSELQTQDRKRRLDSFMDREYLRELSIFEEENLKKTING